ncbi:MAG: DUF5131 family protein [Algiphilus sp.]
MSSSSKIEWTQQTWNPVVGCTKVSAGCKHCYAEQMSSRLQRMGVKDYADGFEVKVLPHRLTQPLQRKTPTVYFVNSMSDLFHPSVTDEFIEQVLHVMSQAHWHTFQLLTKRSERMRKLLTRRAPASNIWLGVSVENKAHGLPRIRDIQRTPCSTRFLSVEPLLEHLGKLDLRGIHWVIVGGESGPKARPMKLDWVENVRHQCERADVPFFFKQWGAWGPDGVRRSKKANGRELHGRLWDGFPETASIGLA